MNSLLINTSDLRPYKQNPRNNDNAIEAVAESIKAFGFKVPIVIDRENVIVCGHTRLKAAQKLKLETVPCVIADDLTDEQIQAFRLADNKTAELAEWDVARLALELDDLSAFDMSKFGFDLETLAGEWIDDAEQQETDDEIEDDEFDDIEKLDKHYGVPYQGNKSRIADIIISLLPEGDRLVDLFGGGGAITHCAMLSGKWERFLYNDINPMITGLFLDAVNGKYHDENRVITREDFEALKDTDAFVKYIWSFGNIGARYLWGKDIEAVKCQACRIILGETIFERRMAYARLIHLLSEDKNLVENKRKVDRLQSFESLQALLKLEDLKDLDAFKNLKTSNIDYKKYKYKKGDVVYCDVPYEQTGKGSCDDYGVKFDSLEFYEWAKAQACPVYFSSYEISDSSFYKKKLKTVAPLVGSSSNGNKVNEYLYSTRPFE